MHGQRVQVSVAMEIEQFEIATGSPKGFTKKGDSGNELTRHFCQNCGSPPFTCSPRHPDLVYVKAGAFDDPTLVQPAHQSWTRSSVPWGGDQGWTAKLRDRPWLMHQWCGFLDF
jgi:hypothetical protein